MIPNSFFPPETGLFCPNCMVIFGPLLQKGAGSLNMLGAHNDNIGQVKVNNVSNFDIAASVQAVMEEYLLETAKWMKANLPSRNLVFMGGCALNCVANSLIAKEAGFDNVWIMPNPGDAGSASPRTAPRSHPAPAAHRMSRQACGGNAATP